MLIEHILLTTDLSEASAHSYPYAAGLVRALGARLTVLHVDEMAEHGFSTSAELSDYLELSRSIRSDRMTAVAEELKHLGVDDVAMQLRSGTPSQQILAFADEQAVDMIIMAKHGPKRRRHFFMGFTSKRMVRHARVPVLVVPPLADGKQPADAPVMVRRILAATDFSHDSNRGLRATLDLAEKLDAAVNAVHVMRVPGFIPALPGEPAIAIHQERFEGIGNRYRLDLERLEETLGSDRLVTTFTIGDDVAESLVETSEEDHCDIIAVPSHGKGAVRAVLFGSTAERLLSLSTKPVLVLPKEFLERPWS